MDVGHRRRPDNRGRLRERRIPRFPYADRASRCYGATNCCASFRFAVASVDSRQAAPSVTLELHEDRGILGKRVGGSVRYGRSAFSRIAWRRSRGCAVSSAWVRRRAASCPAEGPGRSGAARRRQRDRRWRAVSSRSACTRWRQKKSYGVRRDRLLGARPMRIPRWTSALVLALILSPALAAAVCGNSVSRAARGNATRAPRTGTRERLHRRLRGSDSVAPRAGRRLSAPTATWRPSSISHRRVSTSAGCRRVASSASTATRPAIAIPPRARAASRSGSASPARTRRISCAADVVTALEVRRAERARRRRGGRSSRRAARQARRLRADGTGRGSAAAAC